AAHRTLTCTSVYSLLDTHGASPPPLYRRSRRAESSAAWQSRDLQPRTPRPPQSPLRTATSQLRDIADGAAACRSAKQRPTQTKSDCARDGLVEWSGRPETWCCQSRTGRMARTVDNLSSCDHGSVDRLRGYSCQQLVIFEAERDTDVACSPHV